MIVVDSSVWINHFRNDLTREVRLLRANWRASRTLVGDLVLLEILRGARNDVDAARLERELRQFLVVPMMSDAVAVDAARIYRTLRGEGVTIRKTVDLAVATFCIANDHTLLQNDRDFAAIAARFPLRLI